MSLWSRLTNAIRPGSLERDLQEELQFHLEARTRDLMAEGLSKEDAAALAAKRFGNRLRLREDSRDIKLMPGSTRWPATSPSACGVYGRT